MPITPGSQILAADVVEVREHTFMATGNNMCSLPTALGTTAVEGTGTASVGNASADLGCGGAGGGRGVLKFVNIYGFGPGEAATIIDWDKDFHLRFNILRLTTSANAIGRIQLKGGSAEADLGADGIGIVIKNYQIYAESYNTARQETDTTITMADNDQYTIDIVHEAGVDVKFYVDGVLKVTHAVAANVPSGLTVCDLTFSIDNQADAINAIMRIGACISLWQED